MTRLISLLVIICAFVCLGEARALFRRQLPPGIRQICGPSTSWSLALNVYNAYTKASEYAIKNRADTWGWNRAPFLSTARAIMNLQLSTRGEWYGQKSRDQEPEGPAFFGRRWFYMQQQKTEHRESELSAKQLEVEFLAYLGRYLNGTDDLRMMGHTEFASHLVALSLTCHDISNFNGFDLTKIMANRLREFGDNVTVGAPIDGPATSASCDSIIPGGSANRDFYYGFGLLVACQNREVISPDVFRCTIEAQNNELYKVPLVIPGLGAYPLGYGDLQLLGMSCLRDRVPDQYKAEWSVIMTRIAHWMIGMQTEDGSFANNLIATILAVQSLKSAEVSYESWDCEAAVRNILSFQIPAGKGQIGMPGTDNTLRPGDNVGITMLAMPTLSGQSMAYVDDIRPECIRPRE